MFRTLLKSFSIEILFGQMLSSDNNTKKKWLKKDYLFKKIQLKVAKCNKQIL